MDIAKKKQEVLEDIARQPANVVFARIGIVDEIQLADLMKEQFTPKFREAANTSHSNTDSLYEVCVNLAHQRALLQGAAAATNPATGILAFNIDDGNATTRANGTAPHNQKGSLTFPKLEDASFSNKTTIPFVVLHDLNEDGGTVTLSSTSNANTTIVNDEGESEKYFTDFSKYFLTRSRANGEIVSIDENTTPYTTPTTAEPFFPANTINGEIFRGTPNDPTANSDVRFEFALTANTTSVGFAGANNDITENKFVGNTFVILKLSNAIGTFTESENLLDFDDNSATVKTQANTTTVVIESNDVKGTFQTGEILTDGSTNATISTVETGANTTASITLTGNTFITGSNTDVTLGFSTANTITLDENTVVRTDSKVVVTANNHGVSPGEYIVLKGATDDFSEFNDTFIVQDVTQNTLSFTTTNATSVTPTGDFSLVKNILFGRTSNASAAVTSRTVNATAELRIQSANLSVGFPIGNTVTGQSTSATGVIDERTTKGEWYQVKTDEVKTYYIASDSGTWDFDATNNPQGFESTANTGEFWLKNFEMVRINQIVDSSGTGNSFVSPKMVFDISLATSSDTSGGYDSTIKTQNPGIYFAYPLKTYEDQVHDGTTTLEAFDNFASVVIAPEGLEINFDWKPLANSSGVATNSTHINADGTVTTASFNPEEVTILDKDEFNAHLGPYNDVATANSIGGFPNAQDDIFLSAISSNRSSGKNTGNTTINTSTASGFGVDGDVYRSANANPFYPAVAGTHKENSNTLNDITGTQPSTLTANDIYAGTYTEFQKGATEPGTPGNDPGTHNFRYIIQNDLKWCFATSPFAAPVGAAVSSGEGQSAFTPRGTAFQASYDGYSKASNGFGALIDSIEAQSATSHTHDNTIPADSKPSGTGYGGGAFPDNPPTLTDVTINGSPFKKYVGTQPTATGTFVWIISTASGTGASKKVTTTTTSDAIINTTDSGTAAVTKTVTRSTSTTQNYTYNVIQDVLNNANTATFVTMVTTLQTGNESTHGAGFRDPNEPSSPNIKTDATFDADVNTIHGLITSANSYHQGVVSGTSNGYTNGQAHTYANTDYNAFITGIATFQTAMTERITEISNRIGYLNGKSASIANGGTGTKSTGHDTTNGGFAGTSYNGGNGYANTIYSHANFLAGKKIQLLEKIFKSIEDVDELYKQIKSKRSEYYEYNQ